RSRGRDLRKRRAVARDAAPQPRDLAGCDRCPRSRPRPRGRGDPRRGPRASGRPTRRSRLSVRGARATARAPRADPLLRGVRRGGEPGMARARTADPRAGAGAARAGLSQPRPRRAACRGACGRLSDFKRRQEIVSMSNKTYVIGVGMTKFAKPGTKEGDYPDWAREAGENALADAGVPYDSIEQAYAGYVYGDSSYGQRAVYELGLTGIPVLNVNNNCSTGSSALLLARQAVKGGLVDCALAIGFEM